MISSIIDGILLTALAATSVCVLLMYRRLKRFDVLQTEAAAAFARSAKALDNAKAALESLHAYSGEMTVSLASRLNEARMMMNELDRSADEHSAIRARNAAAAKSAPAARAPDPTVDFLAEWEDRFSGMRARYEGQGSHLSAAGEALGAMPSNALIPATPPNLNKADPSPLGQPQSVAVSWRALADAAHRSG